MTAGGMAPPATIPIFFSAASIRCGGSILMTSAFAGFQQALEAGEDRGPARRPPDRMSSSIGAVVRLRQRQPDRIAGRLDLVGHQGRAELLDQPRPVDVPGDGELARRIAFDHLAADMDEPSGARTTNAPPTFNSASTAKPEEILAG